MKTAINKKPRLKINRQNSKLLYVQMLDILRTELNRLKLGDCKS